MTEKKSGQPDAGKPDAPGSRGEGVFHVNNDREGRVASRGEELTGTAILERVGLSSDKYELWTMVGNKTGTEIKATDVHHVKPGNHFRATIRGTDYSRERAEQTGGAEA